MRSVWFQVCTVVRRTRGGGSGGGERSGHTGFAVRRSREVALIARKGSRDRKEGMVEADASTGRIEAGSSTGRIEAGTSTAQMEADSDAS